MEITVDNKNININEVETYLVEYIQSLIQDKKVSLEKLGSLLNVKSNKSNIYIQKNGKKRKINTLIKEYYGGLRQFLEYNDCFELHENIVSLNEEEGFILV